MAFSILYHEDEELPADFVTANLYSLAVYLDSFAQGLGLTELNVDTNRLAAVLASLNPATFPHTDGLKKASPFKKAANFFVNFVAERPILDSLANISDEISKIPNHQNVVFGYHMAVDCLHGAKIYKDDKELILGNKIKVSKHFFKDFVEAFSATTPRDYFRPASLLFEQLAYRFNPDASYETVV
jgi:hypothetical protein